jgi:hypothetical protein
VRNQPACDDRTDRMHHDARYDPENFFHANVNIRPA